MVNKWDLIGKVHRSTYRTKVLKELHKGVKTPSELSEETDIKISHISRALRRLKGWDLVECLNPDLKKGKMYSITELGREVIELLEEREE